MKNEKMANNITIDFDVDSHSNPNMLRTKLRLHSNRNMPRRCLWGLLDNCLQSCWFCKHDTAESNSRNSVHLLHKFVGQLITGRYLPIYNKLYYQQDMRRGLSN